MIQLEKPMTELYLILHKVRGEPAFDVAIPLKIGEEDGWIIPTSGHRAYPAMTWRLEDLADVSDINISGHHDRPSTCNLSLDNLPDHYEVSQSKAPAFDPRAMLAQIGFKREPMRRRV